MRIKLNFIHNVISVLLFYGTCAALSLAQSQASGTDLISSILMH